MTDASKLAAFVVMVRRVIDQCERAADQPIASSTIQDMRERCRQVMLIADRLQRAEDDGK